MSEYVYESGMSTQRRKQRRTAITLMLSLLLLFGAFWWAWAYIRGDDGSAEDQATMSTDSTGCVDAKAVTFNVYNSTRRPGLAKAAADALTAAGFTVGSVANDPESKQLPGNAEIRFGPAGEAYALSFRDHYGQSVSITPDERTGTTVDVALGESFQNWAPFPDADACTGTNQPDGAAEPETTADGE